MDTKHYPEEWGPSWDRRLTCVCGHPDPAHMDAQAAAPVQSSAGPVFGRIHPAPNAAPAVTPHTAAVLAAGGKVYCCYGAYADVGHSDDCSSRKG